MPYKNTNGAHKSQHANAMNVQICKFLSNAFLGIDGPSPERHIYDYKLLDAVPLAQQCTMLAGIQHDVV